MGEVWLAKDTRLGRKVALKLLPAEFTEDSEHVRRFTLEAQAASALNHPNIIAVHDIGQCETGRFIVMEFVTGHTLRSVITKTTHSKRSSLSVLRGRKHWRLHTQRESRLWRE
jgi:serine/threonine protein kinase